MHYHSVVAGSDGAVPAEEWTAGPEQNAVAADLEQLVVIEYEFAALDLALRRLDDGTYGTCESCGSAVDEARLDRAPLTARCARCAPEAQELPPA